MKPTELPDYTVATVQLDVVIDTMPPITEGVFIKLGGRWMNHTGWGVRAATDDEFFEQVPGAVVVALPTDRLTRQSALLAVQIRTPLE